MAQTVTLSTSSTPTAIGAHSVALKAAWGSPWQTVANLYADEVTFAAAPSFSAAKLYWRYGVGKLPGSPTFASVGAQSLLRYYVRIDLDNLVESGNTLGWVGIVEIDADRLTGDTEGRQELVAYGIERVLHMRPITSGFWWHSAANSLRESGAGMTFNAGGKGNRHGNKDDGAFVFTDDVEPPSYAAHWSTSQIVQYLLRKHVTPGAFGGANVPFELRDPNSQLPDWDRPTIDSDQRTVWELCNALIPRHRGMSFFVTVDESASPHKVQLKPFTFAEELVSLGQGAGGVQATLAANPNQFAVELAGDNSAEGVVTTNALDTVDQVVVLGAKRTTTGTLTHGTSEVDNGWESARETEYEDGASNDAGYPGSGEPTERQRLNRRARNVDRLSSVFARFVLSDTFLKTQAVSGTNWFEDDDGNAHIVEQHALRMLPDLILLDGHDYSGSNIGDDNVSTFADGPHSPRPPLVITPLPEDTDFYVDITKIGQAAASAHNPEDTDYKWSARVSVPRDDNAVMIRVSGRPQHVIAKTDFTALSPARNHGELEDIVFDYEDFEWTVTLQEDRRASGRWPDEDVTGEVPRVKVIDAGDAFRLDRVLASTTVGVDREDGTKITSDGGFVNDDGELLQSIAKLAFQWYGVDRIATTLQSSVLTAYLTLGQLVTQVGFAGNVRTVNAPITQVTLQIPRANSPDPGPLSVTYHTAFAEVDPLQLFPD